MQNLKEYWQKLSGKTKSMFIAIVAGTVIIAIVMIGMLALRGRSDYSTLFTGMNQEEAQEVVGLLQEQGVDYRFNDANGSVSIPSAQVDQMRADLLSQGYPQSGFTYDMYRDNTGLMTTESDKKQYTLYELQDRLGAQIRLFDGVQDAKVTIAEAGEQKYALNDNAQTDASASVVVTMKNGVELTPNQASAIKNLIARAVKGMNFTNVSVFDAATMMEVSGETEESSYGEAADLVALTSLVENNIAGNVRRVLEQLYGPGKVAVSVKGTLNMERLIQESTTYATPDKIDAQDKEGLLQKETVASENSGTADAGDGGVVGADANADTPRYTAGNGGDVTTDTYANNSATREWLYNSVKEQRQIDPGVLENTTIGVVIDSDDNTVPLDDIAQLVANSAGISLEEADEKVTVIRALSQASAAAREREEAATSAGSSNVEQPKIAPPVIIAIAAGIILLILLITLLLLRRKKHDSDMMDTEGMNFLPNDGTDGEFPAVSAEGEEASAAALAVEEEEDEFDKNEEIINLRMQRSLKLKQNIGEFVEQNPQIAAKLVQSWLRGEAEADGRSNTKRKQK